MLSLIPLGIAPPLTKFTAYYQPISILTNYTPQTPLASSPPPYVYSQVGVWPPFSPPLILLGLALTMTYLVKEKIHMWEKVLRCVQCIVLDDIRYLQCLSHQYTVTG